MGFPPDSVKGKDIPFGARVLKILSDLIEIESQTPPRLRALQLMRGQKGWYDPEIFDDICKSLSPIEKQEKQEEQKDRNTTPFLAVKVNDLLPGLALHSVIETVDGQLLYFAGQVLSQTRLERIKNYHKLKKIKEPIYVKNPNA